MKKKTLVALSVFIGGAAVPLGAIAQTPPPTVAIDRADELYRRANSLFDAEKYQEAYDLYREAFSLKKSFDIAANLGQTALQLKRYPEAAEALAYSISIYPPNGNPQAKQRQIDMLKDLEGKLAKLRVATSPEGAEVRVDGRLIGRTPLSGDIYVEPGKRLFHVEKAGLEPHDETLDLAAGSSRALNVSLAKHDAPSKPVWPAVLLGIGAAAGIGVGIGLMVASASSHDDAQSAFDDCAVLTNECIASAQDSLDSANALRGGGIAAIGIGGAAAVGLLVYLLVPAKASAGPVAVAPILGPSTAGLHFSYSF